MKYFYEVSGKTADGWWTCRAREMYSPEGWLVTSTARTLFGAVVRILSKLYFK